MEKPNKSILHSYYLYYDHLYYKVQELSLWDANQIYFNKVVE